MHTRLIVTHIIAALMSVGAAQAADLPVKMPVKAPVVAPVFTWNGFYIGAHAGYGWGKNDWSNGYTDYGALLPADGDTPSADLSGGLVGGQIGFNYQVNQFVFGLEADGSWANIKGDGRAVSPSSYIGLNCLGYSDSCSTKIEALGTITGRLGFAWDRALVYAKGGAAWALVNHTSGSSSDPAYQFSSSVDETRWGWTIGAGLEYAFAPNWSAKVEYNYIDLGSDTVSFNYNSIYAVNAGATSDLTIQTVKGGINYRFWSF